MNISKPRERALIRKAQTGDAAAIETLIKTHQDALYAFMLRMSGRPEMAEDIVQEAFVRVLKNLDRFDHRYRFSTWLFTIAKRLFVNALQKHAPAYDSDVVGACAGSTRLPDAQPQRTETIDNLRHVLDEALAGLSEQAREIVLLFHQQNWPITDIAEHLGMPEGTVKSHLHRARKRMYRLIVADDQLRQHAMEVWS